MNKKTLSVLPALLLLLAGASHAQTTPVKGGIGSNPAATAMTREMSARLHLNESQFIKLASINRTRMGRQQEIERATPSDAAARTAQLAELQAQYEQECARILTPSQLSQLQQDPTQFTVDGGRG